MKKALTIILTLILGFGANYLITLGSFLAALIVALTTNLSIIWYIVMLAVIAAFTALLNFARGKCKNQVHGAVFILCAQLPWIVFSAFEAEITAFAASLVIMAAAFIAWAVSANKDKIRKWWNEIFKNGKENTI